MKTLLRLPPLLLLVLWLTACTLPTEQLFLPDLKVTPALTPIAVPTSTPTPIQSVADPVAEVTPSPSPSPQPLPPPVPPSQANAERTPIYIKVPASSLTQPTVIVLEAVETQIAMAASPTPAPEPTATPAPSLEPTTEVAVAAKPTTVPDIFTNTLNILVVGSDERSSGNPWRADVIMVVAVEPTTQQVGVVSFPRDLYIDIPTVGKNRINTATFFGELNNYKDGGGIGLLEKTIEKNFGIRIDNYVKINFSAFKDTVDALGGIDVKVDCPIRGKFPREPGSQELVYQTLQPGEYHMDGLFALRYARERKTTSDVDRTRRQQRVLIAIRNRARELNIVTRLKPLYDALSKSIETDLGLTDILSLAQLGIRIDADNVHGFIIGFKETDSWTTPSGAYVLLPKMNMINERIKHLFAEPSILKNPQKPRNCQNATAEN